MCVFGSFRSVPTLRCPTGREDASGGIPQGSHEKAPLRSAWTGTGILRAPCCETSRRRIVRRLRPSERKSRRRTFGSRRRGAEGAVLPRLDQLGKEREAVERDRKVLCVADQLLRFEVGDDVALPASFSIFERKYSAVSKQASMRSSMRGTDRSNRTRRPRYGRHCSALMRQPSPRMFSIDSEPIFLRNA